MSTLTCRRSLKSIWPGFISLWIASTLLVACLPAAETGVPPPWQYADLRILAAPGIGVDSPQLVSLYTRRYRSDLQVRLDLLNYDPQDEFDLYLAIDGVPGGKSQLPINAQAGFDWDLLLSIPSSGPLIGMGAGGEDQEGLRLRVARNPLLDTLTVSLDHSAAGERFRVQAFLTGSGSTVVVSSLGPVRSDAQPPKRLPLALAFWNTYHAYTPSQALRRLDGAHTGPSSDRHGLRGLLDAVESASFPALLLDIKTPASLSALDYAGGLDRVQGLAAKNLLILTDVYSQGGSLSSYDIHSDWYLAESANKSDQVREAFGLQPSSILYTTTDPSAWPSNLLIEFRQHRLIFLNSSSPTFPAGDQVDFTVAEDHQAALRQSNLSPKVSRWGAYTVVDLSSLNQDLLDSDQAAYTGPSLEIRRALLEAATDPTGSPFILLGGDLSKTSWGNSTAATQTLNYLKSRPWLQPVTAADLASVRSPQSSGVETNPNPRKPVPESEIFTTSPISGDGLISAQALEQVRAFFLEDLKRTPENAASQLARQAYAALLAPPVLPHPDLAPLRANYYGQVGHLLAAARWEESGPGAFCSFLEAEGHCITAGDFDWDDENEYVMASQEVFLLFEPRGGYISTAFWRGPDGVHQVIAPSSQFVVGIGDPMSWEPAKGVAGDPGQYRGAFSDLLSGFSTPSWDRYNVEIASGSLSFIALDGSSRKIFSISPAGFKTSYNTSVPLTVQIPLAVDPSIRFTPGWGNQYISNPLGGGWLWGLRDGPQVQISSVEEMSFSAFSDSYAYMGLPEDPDFDFPSGHFLPFPMALIEIRAGGEFSIEISMVNP